jgi:hypothetical protein
VTAATWSHFFDAGDPVHALVATEGTTIRGLVHVLYHRSTTMLGLTCYLQDLLTIEAARVRGVAAHSSLLCMPKQNA